MDYAIGALLAGRIAVHYGFMAAISAVGVMTLLSGVVVAVAMQNPRV
jgi:hypothetical protein